MPESGSEPSQTSFVVTRPVEVAPIQSRVYSHGQPQASLEVVKDTNVEVKNLDEYQQWYKEPYSLKFFEVSNLPTFTKYADTIESYVRSQIESLHLSDTLDSYRSVIREVERAMGLQENAESSWKMEKIAKWIKGILMPQSKIEERKRRILG